MGVILPNDPTAGRKYHFGQKCHAFSNFSLLLLEKLTGHDFEVVFSARTGIVKDVRGTFIKTGIILIFAAAITYSFDLFTR